VQAKRAGWEVRVSGIDDVRRVAESIPMRGRRGQALTAALARPELRAGRGSRRGYLPASQTEPVLAYLRGLGVTPGQAAQLVGEGAGGPQGGLRSVLGGRRLRRDRLQRLADGLGSEFLAQVLDEDVWYDRIQAVSPPEWRPVYDIEVDDLHTFVANDVVVHNCASPFKQAEFDIMFGKGISREGSLLDVGVDQGLVKKSGAWYTYDGEQLGQGRENAKNFLAENPEIMVEISERIRQQLAPAPPAPPAGAADPDDEPLRLD
jgi:hypothetical protein